VRLFDFGEQQPRAWFQQILDWSRNKVSVEENLDCVIISVNIATSETIVDHPLGRVPKGIIPVLRWPNNISELSWTREPTDTRLFLSQRVAGQMTLLIF
jgi:hypothetical protein